MVDKYTNTVLTVIAASLVILIVEGLVPKATAGQANCGQGLETP